MARGTVSVQKPEAGMVAAPAAVNAARLPVTGRGRTGSRFSNSAKVGAAKTIPPEPKA